MGFRIERHGPRFRQGLDRIHNGVFVRAVLVNHCDRAFTIGIKNKPRVRIEDSGIYVVADGKRCDHLTTVGVHHSHHLAAATDEQSPARPVHRHARG